MIYGIGTDIVAIPRMQRVFERFGGRLAERLLSSREQEEYVQATHKERFLAKRFAAKEAFAKAAGTGLRAPLLLTALSVVHDELGRPAWAYTPELADWLAARGIGAAHLSISDEEQNVVAFTVLEQQCR